MSLSLQPASEKSVFLLDLKLCFCIYGSVDVEYSSCKFPLQSPQHLQHELFVPYSLATISMTDIGLQWRLPFHMDLDIYIR